MNSLHLAPFPRPLASLVDDYPPEQGHKGWLVRFGDCRQDSGSAAMPHDLGS